jgi:hypothetical protein
MAGKIGRGFADRYTKFPVTAPEGPAPSGISTFEAPVSDAVAPPVENSTQVEITQFPVWLYPPSQWENIDLIAYALLPAIGATVIILQFQVPLGRNGVIKAIANNFVGGGWVEGTGDVIWKLLVDGASPPNANSYGSIPASLGSPANPVPIPGFRIWENQVITFVGLNNPAGPDGGVVVAGQRLGARIVGYLYPRDSEDSDVWV